MPDRGNVLFITVDQWRGDCLSAVGHPVVRTPNLDRLAASGALFTNHWAQAAPCGPSRACLYTGTYQSQNRSVLNGTPLDSRLTNVALETRAAGLDPVLFGYTDSSIDPRTVPRRRSAAAHLRGCAAGDAGGARLPVRAAHPLDRPPLRPRLPRAEAGPRHLPGRPVVPGRGRPPADVGAADLPGRAQRDGLPHRRAAGLAGRCRDDDQPGRRASGPGRAVVRPPELPATAPALPGGRPVPRPVRPGRRARSRSRAPTREQEGSQHRLAELAVGVRRRPGGRGRDAPDPGHLLRAHQRGRPPPRAGARLARLHRAGHRHPRGADLRPRRPAGRPLAHGEARLLGRELPRADARARPALARRGAHRCLHRARRRDADDPRVARPRRRPPSATAGRSCRS